MIEIIENVPDNVAAFKTSGKVDKADYDRVLIPAIDKLVKEQHAINFLLLPYNDITDFTLAAILQDIGIGIKHFTKWHKMAIVSGSAAITNFTDFFSFIAPGEAKGFEHNQLHDAIKWVSS